MFEERQLGQAFALLSTVAEAIAAVIGDQCQVAVHDLRTPQPVVRLYGTAAAAATPPVVPWPDELSSPATDDPAAASDGAPAAAVWMHDLTGHPVGALTITRLGSKPEPSTITLAALRAALRVPGKPATSLQRHERIALVRALDQAGVFSLRRAVETTARDLGVSRATLYTYLRAARGGDAA